MGRIDAAAPEPVDVLISRAGAAVAHAALGLLGGAYGRRVVVLAGKGNNGNDGRAAGERLRRRGVRVQVIDVASAPDVLPRSDLVIDAAFGTGFRGSYTSPDPGGAPVLAVDIPSGVDGLTGAGSERVLEADLTVTFAAYKPGLLLDPGRALSGHVEIADIGLDTSGARAHLIDADDAAAWLPRRDPSANKWSSSVVVVSGSPGMTGSAHLSSAAAQRIGAGMVRLGSPGLDDDPARPVECVGLSLPDVGFDGPALDALDRYRALVVGPGLGRSGPTVAAVQRLVAASPVPTLVDADGLYALAQARGGAAAVLRQRRAGTVLTPHDGEYRTLSGALPGPDRLEAVRSLAAATGAVVLLKGRTTTVAEPSGQVLLSTTGDPRLATAGTGDVLSGVIGGLLAQGLPPIQAAALGAYLHGVAGTLGWPDGLVASDLLGNLPRALSDPGVWP